MSDLAVRAAPARPNFNGLWVAPPLIVLGLTFLYPLVLIARAALVGDAGGIDLGGFLSVLHSRAFLNALINTGLIALAATAGCLVLGVTLAPILAFVPFPGSTFVARLIDTFIALPTFLVTLAFTFLYGSAGMLNGALTQSLGLSEPPVHFLYSAWGVILAEVTVYTPFVLRPLLAAFSLVDQSQIEVAGLLGAKPWRIVRNVILPAALPAAIAGGSLCLLLTVNEFGIVLFIGAKGVITLPLLIYDKAIQESDYQAACTIAIVNARCRSASSRSIASPLGGSEAEPRARLVALRPFHHMAPRSFAHRNHLHRAVGGHSRRKLSPSVERCLTDGLHPRTLRVRAGGASATRWSASLITGLLGASSRFFADPGRGWLCARKGRRGAGPWACSTIPSAVPVGVVGLRLLVAFSQRPLLLNGTTAIVILAHFVLISPSRSAMFGRARTAVAGLRGGRLEPRRAPTYRLFKVTLPLIALI